MSLGQGPFDPNDRILFLANSNDTSDSPLIKAFQGQLIILSPDEHASISSLKENDYDGCASSLITLPYSLPYLTHILRVIKPSGHFSILCPSEKSNLIYKSLVYSGFTDSKIIQLANISQVTGRKPPWNIGASAPLNFKHTNKINDNNNNTKIEKKEKKEKKTIAEQKKKTK